MKRWLRRFAAVGTVVTLIDVVIVVVLRDAVGLPVIIADFISVTVAGAASFAFHRAVTFHDDPHVRLVREPGPFLRVGFLGVVIDVVVLRSMVLLWPLLPAKLVSLSLATAVRLLLYRRLLFSRVRGEQSRRADRPPPPGDVRFSVVVPAYKAGSRIGATVAQLREALAGVEHEIVVVDDGSADDTADAARAAGADQVLVHPRNRGKGGAVRTGMLAARGRAVAFTDADLAYPPAQLLRLLAEVEAGWDMVVGNRHHIETATLVRARRLRELSGRVFNAFTLLVVLGQYRDTQCGLKAWRSDAAHRVFTAARIDGFAFDVELFHLAERYRLSLKEVPVELANTDTSTVRVGVDSLRMIRDLVRIRRLASSGSYEEAPLG